MARRPDDLDAQRVSVDDQRDYTDARDARGASSVAASTDGNGTAIAAMVIGLLAATFGFLVLAAPAAILFGLVAAVLGAMGLSKAGRLGGLHKGLAITGLVSGLLGLLLGIAVVIGGVNLFNQAQDELRTNDELQQRLDQLEQQVQQTQPG